MFLCDPEIWIRKPIQSLKKPLHLKFRSWRILGNLIFRSGQKLCWEIIKKFPEIIQSLQHLTRKDILLIRFGLPGDFILQDPYPSANEKQQLARISGLSHAQVKTWFANARRRSKSNSEEFQRKCSSQLNIPLSSEGKYIPGVFLIPSHHKIRIFEPIYTPISWEKIRMMLWKRKSKFDTVNRESIQIWIKMDHNSLYIMYYFLNFTEFWILDDFRFSNYDVFIINPAIIPSRDFRL